MYVLFVYKADETTINDLQVIHVVVLCSRSLQGKTKVLIIKQSFESDSDVTVIGTVLQT